MENRFLCFHKICLVFASCVFEELLFVRFVVEGAGGLCRAQRLRELQSADDAGVSGSVGDLAGGAAADSSAAGAAPGGGGSGGSGAAKLRGESVRAGLRKGSFGSVICRTIAIAPIRASASNYA